MVAIPHPASHPAHKRRQDIVAKVEFSHRCDLAKGVVGDDIKARVRQVTLRSFRLFGKFNDSLRAVQLCNPALRRGVPCETAS